MGAETKKLGLETEVAVTVMASLGGDSGAVYRPAELIVPQFMATLQPFTLQVTAVLLSVEVTVGVNCTVPPARTIALVGKIEIVTVGAVSVTVAVPICVVSACDVAVIVWVVLAGRIVGAVYRPVAVIVPVVALPPGVPSTAQVTAVFVEPATVAVNCCVAPPAMLAVVGEMVTDTVVVVVDELLLLPPHPTHKIAIATTHGRNRLMKSPLKPKKSLSPKKLFRIS